MSPSVLVVGTGLIGTSLGLALHGERRVLLADQDAGRLSAAQGRGAGVPWDGAERVDVAVVAVPPGATAAVLQQLRDRQVAAVFTHVASTQSRVQHDLLEGLDGDLSMICGGHPLAGREVTGPAGATPALFSGRPWVACPSPATSDEAVSAVCDLARACGAEPLVMTAEAHDRAVALSSHLPQLTASALAARLAADGAAVQVSGPGSQDTTRIAASDPGLWTDVLTANAAEVGPVVADLADELGRAATALAKLADRPDDADAAAVLRDLLVRGNTGRALVPVKAGVLDRDVAVVAVRVPDEPGQLAELLARAAGAGVNVEDIRVEHLAGRRTGIVELLVTATQQAQLTQALTRAGAEVLTTG